MNLNKTNNNNTIHGYFLILKFVNVMDVVNEKNKNKKTKKRKKKKKKKQNVGQLYNRQG